LVRIRGREDDDKKNWLLIKERDPDARPSRARDVVKDRPESVLSGRTIEDVGRKVWPSNRPAKKSPAKAPTKAPARRAGVRSRGPDPGSIPGAREAAMPAWTELQLATLVTEAPDGEDWIHEIKYDGYRFLCRVERGRARLLTRSGL